MRFLNFLFGELTKIRVHKANSLLTYSERIRAFTVTLKNQKIEAFNRFWPQTKVAFHSVVQLFIWFCEFVYSVFRLFVFIGERSVGLWILNSVIQLFVCLLGCSFARSSVSALVCVSDFSSYSFVCPVLLVKLY